MTVRAEVGAGSAVGFVLGAGLGAVFGNAGAEAVRASAGAHDKAMLIGGGIGAFLGAVGLAAVAAPKEEQQQQAQFQVRFP